MLLLIVERTGSEITIQNANDRLSTFSKVELYLWPSIVTKGAPFDSLENWQRDYYTKCQRPGIGVSITETKCK